MKKLYTFLLPCILLSSLVSAQTIYWVGPDNGSFDNSANWSATSGGAGGVGIPGASSNLVFDRDARVNITNGSNTVNSILITGNKNVRLYTATNTVLTVTSGNSTTPGLKVDAGSTLKDSTAGDVGFDFMFPAASLGTVNGNWEFEGNTDPITGNAAGFTVQSSGVVNVAGTVNFKDYSNNIDVNNQANVNFGAGSFYLQNNRLGGEIADVTYNTTSTISVLGARDAMPSFAGPTPLSPLPSYGNVIINVPLLTQDASLAIPNDATIKGNLEFLNTNNHTVSILSNIGTPDLTVNHLMISGANTNVAIASATIGTLNKSYNLQVNDFTQTAGIFSFQQNNAVTNTTTLGVSGDVDQTGGDFGIASTATSTGTTDLFLLEMNGTAAQTISLQDNIQNRLTLKMNTTSGATASLLTPLSVGRLDLSSGNLITSTVAVPANFLTVTDVDAANGVKNGSAASYVDGMLRRATNSTLEYRFPTGKGGFYHTISVIPSGTSGSVFQAEYFPTGYSNLTVQDPPLKGVAENEYWLLGMPSGTDNAAVKLTLTAPVPRATASHTIVVARYNGTLWQSVQGVSGTFISPGNASSGTVVSDPQNITSTTPFTFGIAGTAALPIHLESFEAKKLNGGASLEWKTEELPVQFEVLRSSNGADFSKIGTVKANPGVKTYKYFDAQLLPGTNYYRLRSVETDGAISYSKVVAVINKETGIEITTLAPNVITDRAKLSISAARGGKMELMITDMSGRTWRKFGFAVSPGNSDTWLNLSDLAAGVYQITGYMNGEKTSTLRFFKK
jgi:hypothetical protein